jgi:HAD superfamily hydrolase (TIGR01509 family)
VIKAIIFDCFGVLTADTWREFLGNLDEEVDIEAARNAHRAYDAGQIAKQECAELIKSITGQSFNELEDIFGGESDKNTRLLKYIAGLKENYKIGLLSNVGNNWIRDYFLTPDEQKLFDAFVFSFQAGMTKPDPRIFDMMLEKLSVHAAEAVMVDDIERYAEAARGQGLQAICYQDFQQFKKDLDSILSHS